MLIIKTNFVWHDICNKYSENKKHILLVNVKSITNNYNEHEPNDSTQPVLHAEAVPHGFIPKFIRTIRRPPPLPPSS